MPEIDTFKQLINKTEQYKELNQWVDYRRSSYDLARQRYMGQDYADALDTFLEICYFDMNQPQSTYDGVRPPFDPDNAVLAPDAITSIRELCNKLSISDDKLKERFAEIASGFQQNIKAPVPIDYAWLQLSNVLQNNAPFQPWPGYRAPETQKKRPPSQSILSQPWFRSLIVGLIVVAGIYAVYLKSLEAPSQPIAPVASPCQPASDAQIEAIQSGVQGMQASNSIKTAFVVKSTDYANVYFVAAKIYGPQAEEGTGPGLWAMGGTPDKPAIVMSVNPFAKSFTNYPDGSKTDAKLSQFDAGAQEAIECAK